MTFTWNSWNCFILLCTSYVTLFLDLRAVRICTRSNNCAMSIERFVISNAQPSEEQIETTWRNYNVKIRSPVSFERLLRHEYSLCLINNRAAYGYCWIIDFIIKRYLYLCLSLSLVCSYNNESFDLNKILLRNVRRITTERHSLQSTLIKIINLKTLIKIAFLQF